MGFPKNDKKKIVTFPAVAGIFSMSLKCLHLCPTNTFLNKANTTKIPFKEYLQCSLFQRKPTQEIALLECLITQRNVECVRMCVNVSTYLKGPHVLYSTKAQITLV